MKRVCLTAERYAELNRKGMINTPTYRYNVFFADDGRQIVKCIRRENLGTTATLSDASDINPNGWEQVEIRVKGVKNNV